MPIIETPINTREAWSDRAAMPAPWDAAGWSRRSQRERFDAVLARLDLRPGDTVLDFGCGTGELADRIPSSLYVGYDSAPGMVARAQVDHPLAHFTSKWPAGRFDHVIAVGPFNLPGGWSKQHTFHALRHLWDSTGCRSLIVSVYAGDDERCLRYSPNDLLVCGHSLGLNVTVEQWRANDLLMVVRR